LAGRRARRQARGRRWEIYLRNSHGTSRGHAAVPRRGGASHADSWAGWWHAVAARGDGNDCWRHAYRGHRRDADWRNSGNCRVNDRSGNGYAWSGDGSGHVISSWKDLLLWNNVVLLSLCGQLTLSLVTMALALAVFFVGILNANLLAKKVLAVHGVDSGITSLERIETDEAIAFGDIVIVANDVGLAKNPTKTAECVVENFFVDKGVEVVDEEFCTDIDRLLLVCARLVDTDWFVEDTSAIENSGCILGRSRGIEFDKAVALMVLGDSILWHMDLTHRTHLRHELGEPLLRETLVYVAYVDGGIFILLPVFRHFVPAANRGGEVMRVELFVMYLYQDKAWWWWKEAYK